MQSRVEIIGTVEKIIFKSPDNGFAVFALKINNNETVIAKGYIGSLHAGSDAVLRGLWGFHPKYGRQFEADECVAQQPSSLIGIERYLSSGLIKGIGPKFAEKLVKAFGLETLEVIDKTPQRLMSIEGVGPKRVKAIIAAWNDQKEISRVMVFLQGKEVSSSYAIKIFKQYGNQSIEKIQDNPYRLVDDIWGIGFKTADQIALKLGLEKNSLNRVMAGILYAISQATDQGNLYIQLSRLKEESVKVLELVEADCDALIKSALKQLYDQEKIKLVTYQEDHYVTLPQYYFSEKGIAQKILRLAQFKSKLQEIDTTAIFQQIRLPDSKGVELNEDQQRGILSCLQNKVSVITGGPGTGKTTLVKRLIGILEESGIKFRLAAPTGRAAKRMYESTGRNTETLHRLLEFTPASMGFERNEQNALELDILIVDEASMIDVFLMHSVLKALPWHASLLLLGDIDQLPSVGAGNVLNDIIASNVVPVIRLTQIFRQAQDSMIIVNAHRVNHGDFPLSAQPGSKKDFAFVKQEAAEELFPLLQTLYTQRLPKLGISPDDTIVLAPMNRGIAGTARINQELQNILNPGGEPDTQIAIFGIIYKQRDRVMQIRNNYEKFVFNGDIGTIISINKAEEKAIVKFAERELEYDFAEMNELTLAYAISIHKSQGSEFQAVIIPIFMQHFILLQRNLIYTAITRAKRLCVLVGQPKAVAMGIANNKGLVRCTFLKQYLTSDLAAR